MSNLAAAEGRVRRVLHRRCRAAPSYWREHGTNRFARELTQDGPSIVEANVILRRIARELHPVEVDLDAVLAAVRERSREFPLND
jgi:hypothetical protein